MDGEAAYGCDHVVGGGTAGSALATRLTEDADVRVRGVEGGPSDAGDARIPRLRNRISLLDSEFDTGRTGAADDSMAVADPRLRVRGVGGLRVVDASVFPTVPTVDRW